MKVEIKKVDQNNLGDIISLRVHHTQQNYIETPAKCLQDAKECPFYQPVGLYVDGVLLDSLCTVCFRTKVKMVESGWIAI